MPSFLVPIAIALGGVAFWFISSFRSSIAKAKSTGLPYYLVPCPPWFILWQLTHKLWLPLIKLFPKAWWESWVAPMTPDFSYKNGHKHFARFGDAFLLVAPFSCFLFTDNAEAICEITTRREQFPKAVANYTILEQFGVNILTSEGQTWRHHRKITSASFNEKNASLVFREAIKQTQGLLQYWLPAGKTGSGTLVTLEQDTMRLALNIIGYVGFGLSLPWPGEKMADGLDPTLAKYGSLEAPEGHKLSFVDTIAVLLEHILLLLLVPMWLLKKLPVKKTNLAADSRDDYVKYMNELLDEKIDEARKGFRAEEGMDLMGQLVGSSYGSEEKPKEAKLSRAEIIGNAFIMLVAGHETTANAFHFTLLELAANPGSQRRLQKELDEMLGKTDPAEWDYESLVNPMMSGMLGACMNETLRILPPVTEIPKIVTPNQDQTLTIDGKTHVIPKGTHIGLCAAAVHVNPRYWPARPSKITPGQDDIVDYVPERWFRAAETKTVTDVADEEDYGGFRGPDTSASLFRPERGAYIPFSDGARSCLGRRIAQVEIVAGLAVLLREHSIELAVDDWANDEAVANMSGAEKQEVYKKAQDNARAVIAGASSLLTLKLHGKHVPARLVRRGEERFVNSVDSGSM